ncbi:MAG: [protein-PII] uridylyltransferase [Dermatophilaceae bacterium]|nr:[protein-PII] uridylyltransferase [Intrasporangiaceae bacterium]
MSLPSEVTRPGPSAETGRSGRADVPAREGLAGLTAVVGTEGFAAPGAGARRRVAISSYLTGWLAGHWAEATDGIDPTGAALVVLGSIGRGDAGPSSDLDIVILHDTRARVSRNIQTLADRLLYPLWDTGMRVDHSVRTLAQCRDVASADLIAAIGLLDLAHVAGDPEVSASVRASIHHDWRKAARTRLPSLVEALRARHARYDDLSQSIEPDLKESRGGLRDVTVIQSLVTAWLADQPHGRLDDATDLLLDVRDAIHVSTGRGRSRLIRDIHDDVAGLLGMADRDALLTEISGAGRAIAYGLDATLRKAGQAQRARTLRVGPRRPQLTPLGYGFYENDGELVAGPRGLAQSPTTPLRCAVTAARAGLPISPVTLGSLAAMPHELGDPWPPEARGLWADLLATGDGLLAVWEGLDQIGLVHAWLPEWAAVRSRPQRSPIHRHTVDRHLLETVVESSRLMRSVARPDLFLLAALLHDIGKVAGASDHSAAGVPIATKVLDRMGYPERDRDLVVAAVAEHLTLMDLATRHDPTDPETIETAYATVRGDHELAEVLVALSEADARAAGATSWSSQREALFRSLTSGLRSRLGPTVPAQVRDVPEAGTAYPVLDETTRAQVRRGEPVIVVEADGPGYRIDVIEADRPRLFADCASAFASSGLTVRGAVIRTTDDVAVDSWSVDSPAGVPDLERVRRALERLAMGSAPVRSAPRRLRARERPPPVVLIHPDLGRGGVVLDVRCADRPGLLADLGYAIARTGFEIRSADVRTYAGQARDLLLVRPVGVVPASSAGLESLLGAVTTACR